MACELGFPEGRIIKSEGVKDLDKKVEEIYERVEKDTGFEAPYPHILLYPLKAGTSIDLENLGRYRRLECVGAVLKEGRFKEGSCEGCVYNK